MIEKTDITAQDLEYYKELSERYDSPDFGEEDDEDWERRHPIMDMEETGPCSSVVIYVVDMDLDTKIRALAHLRGETAEKLMEAWLWDRLRKEAESEGVDLESLGVAKPIAS